MSIQNKAVGKSPGGAGVVIRVRSRVEELAAARRIIAEADAGGRAGDLG